MEGFWLRIAKALCQASWSPLRTLFIFACATFHSILLSPSSAVEWLDQDDNEEANAEHFIIVSVLCESI